MQYRYSKNRNFEDYAGGRVFYSLPGQPAFPVRLASEIFQRTLEHWRAVGRRGPCTIYDPVCGGAYWLVVLAYLHWQAIEAIFASDIDAGVLPLATRNLSLVAPVGLDKRLAEIETMLAAYHKKSHAEALASAQVFREQLDLNLASHTIKSLAFQADATNFQSMSSGMNKAEIDIVLADVPYGWHSDWQQHGPQSKVAQAPVEMMLDALHKLLNPGTVVAIAMDKSQKVEHDEFHRLERFQVGRRRVFILLHP